MKCDMKRLGLLTNWDPSNLKVLSVDVKVEEIIEMFMETYPEYTYELCSKHPLGNLVLCLAGEIDIEHLKKIEEEGVKENGAFSYVQTRHADGWIGDLRRVCQEAYDAAYKGEEV